MLNRYKHNFATGAADDGAAVDSDRAVKGVLVPPNVHVPCFEGAGKQRESTHADALRACNFKAVDREAVEE